MDLSETLAVVAVALMLVVVLWETARSLVTGRCGVGGWGVADRATSPLRYWTFVTFHVAIAVALTVGLIAEAID